MQPGESVTIVEGSIQASITDTLQTSTILYELDTNQSNFTLEDNTKCDITLSPSFDLSHLGQDGIYELSIKAYVQDDPSKSTLTVLEIPFEVNKLPPIFTSENTAYISDPKFSGKKEIITVEAQDGDSEINADIHYELMEIPNCPDCFEISATTGILEWIGEIPKETILEKKIEFEVRALEFGIPDGKTSSAKIVITFPGDELNPEFTKPKYTADLTRVSKSKISFFNSVRTDSCFRMVLLRFWMVQSVPKIWICI